MKQIAQFKIAKAIKIKIGIHMGPVIAGVIGDHKPQFSLIGDTVNTTSRVCSTGNDDEITLSEQAYDQVKQLEEYSFKLRVVNAKGKGNLNTYIVKKSVRRKKNRTSSILMNQKRSFKKLQKNARQANIDEEDNDNSYFSLQKRINNLDVETNKKIIQRQSNKSRTQIRFSMQSSFLHDDNKYKSRLNIDIAKKKSDSNSKNQNDFLLRKRSSNDNQELLCHQIEKNLKIDLNMSEILEYHEQEVDR